MRAGEMNGRHYYFLTPEEFARRRAAGEFLECAEVHRSGYWYGTLLSEMDRIRQAGAWALLEVDVEGALNVVKAYPDALTIFLQTPSEELYERRLRERGTESEEVIQRRLQTARRELQLAGSYRYRVVNDDLDRAVAEICAILEANKAGTHAG
jgi:guanylate kinase